MREATPELSYVTRIARATQRLAKDRKGEVVKANVEHDRRCDMVNARGVCSCRPVIHLKTRKGLFKIGRNGTPRLVATTSSMN